MNNKSIYFFIGTTAELIKVFPIMQQMYKENIQYKIIASGQNRLDQDIMTKTGINPIDIYLYNKPIKQSAIGVLFWFIKTLIKSLLSLKKEFHKLDKTNSYMIVHGDTVSTVMGAMIGRFYGLKVVHVEAGLRSFNYFKPFPEEIDRMIVSKLTDIHCCPNKWSMHNIKSNKGIKISTEQNTLLDSLSFALSLEIKSDLYDRLADQDFFVFVFHRQENLFDEKLLHSIFKKITEYSKHTMKCLLILHAPTKEALMKNNLLSNIEAEETIITTNRLNYFEFMKILSISKFIVTDGGSNQEESYYFGKPCLILRNETERNEGLNENVVLSKLDFDVIDGFLQNYTKYQRDFIQVDEKPSSKIVSTIMKDS